MGGTTTLPPQGQPLPLKDGEFSGASIPNLVSFAFQHVTPPGVLYIQRDDLLVIQANTQVAPDTLTITARLLLPYQVKPAQPRPDGHNLEPLPVDVGPGSILTIQRTLAIPTNGTFTSLIIPLAEGYLFSVAITSSAALSFGQTYVTAFIGRGSPGGAVPTPAALLIADYPTNVIPVGWPPVPIRQTSTGQGFFQSLAIGNPAAGNNWTFTATTGLRTRVHSARFQLTTSAAVATRDARITLVDNAGHGVFDMSTGVGQTATNTFAYNYGLGMNFVNDTTNSIVIDQSFPAIDMLGSWVLSSAVTNMQAADQIANVVLSLETFVA